MIKFSQYSQYVIKQALNDALDGADRPIPARRFNDPKKQDLYLRERARFTRLYCRKSTKRNSKTLN